MNNVLYFEQDGASAHTSRTNMVLIDKLFGKNALIQNPPNSPDLSYPIEYLWAYIKPKIKRRNPQTIEELKKVTLEEWNAIPKKLIDNCEKNYKKRLEKVIEMEGERLEPVHLLEIKKELNDEEDNEDNMEKEEQNTEKLKMKMTYNDQKLNFLRKKEIKDLKKKIKAIKRATKKKIKKNNEKTKKIPGIVLFRKKRKETLKKKEEIDVKALEAKIKKLEKMGIADYLNYSKELYEQKKEKEENIEEESTIDESFEKIIKIKDMINENFFIKYELEF